MKKLAVAIMIIFFTTGYAWAECYQDQYGNQYNITIDYDNSYLYGEMISNQSCDAPIWTVTGSYVQTSNGIIWEMTPANPLGEADTSCMFTYKIKGTFPDGAWYYSSGYGGQEFTLLPCGEVKVESVTEGGARK